MAITPFADSPRNGGWGDRPYALIDWAGPTSYAVVVNGTAPALPTGGQAITAAAFGLTTGLEGVEPVGGSISGTYEVCALQTVSYNQGQPNANWTLRWLTSATGAEVVAGTNLSAEIIRLRAFGPY
jgi:hypothetical protein